MPEKIKFVINPLKSVAIALLLCVVLGPIGLLYATSLGALMMMIIGLMALGAHAKYALLLVWLVTCFWGVMAVERQNKKWIKKGAHAHSHQTP